MTQPLTPEEQALLGQLNYQQALAAWQAREDARLAALTKLTPLDGAIDMVAITDALAAVDAAHDDLDTRNRIARIRTILSHDLAALLDRLAQLQTPEPEPVAPAAEEEET